MTKGYLVSDKLAIDQAEQMRTRAVLNRRAVPELPGCCSGRAAASRTVSERNSLGLPWSFASGHQRTINCT